MTNDQAWRFAEEWVSAWNRHDVDAVLSHYADDFEMVSPMIAKVMGVASGTLKGKSAVGDYWRAALRKVPDLAFSIIDVTVGVGCVSIYYHAVMGRRAIETFFFNDAGQVVRATATYDVPKPA